LLSFIIYDLSPHQKISKLAVMISAWKGDSGHPSNRFLVGAAVCSVPYNEIIEFDVDG
jgi:hypothetical protein